MTFENRVLRKRVFKTNSTITFQVIEFDVNKVSFYHCMNN